MRLRGEYSMSSRLMNLDGTVVGGDNIYIICEIGHNHGGSVERCKEMFKAAREAGADAVKLQKRFNRELFTREFYNSPYMGVNSYGRTYGEHREALEFDWEQYKELKAYCEELGITFIVSAYEFKGVDFVERLGVPCHKISSFDLLNTPLLRYVAQMGKPIILSTGGGTYDDVQRAYETIMAINPNLILLHCTSSYPVDAQHIHLLCIAEYKRRYPELVIGFSDHFRGTVFGAPAYVLGARVFEKHFTLNRQWKGTDQGFSLEPEQLREYIGDIRTVRLAMDKEKRLDDCETKGIYKMGKKLVASKDLVKGEILKASDIKIVSPNDGLPPYFLDKLLGCVLQCNIEEGGNIRMEDIE